MEGSAAKPLLLHAEPQHLALDELYSKLLMGSRQHRVTSLRHLDLAIVVRSAAARDRLKAAGVQATILTVMEAKGRYYIQGVGYYLFAQATLGKHYPRSWCCGDPEFSLLLLWPGLEFPLVILCDFIRDCPSNDAAQIWDLQPLDDSFLLAQRVVELKCLYTAITRESTPAYLAGFSLAMF